MIKIQVHKFNFERIKRNESFALIYFKMNQVYLTVACYVFLCAKSSATEIEGTDVKEGDFKYNAAIYSIGEHSANAFPLCGGAVLNEWYILTSAQDIYQYVRRLDELIVYLGTTDIRDVRHTRIIAEIKYPNEPNYKFIVGQWHHDVALVRVKAKIDFSDTVQPIALPANADVFDGTLITCGFDRAIKTVSDYSSKLYFKKSKIL